jgi:hypothetical protein
MDSFDGLAGDINDENIINQHRGMRNDWYSKDSLQRQEI